MHDVCKISDDQGNPSAAHPPAGVGEGERTVQGLLPEVHCLSEEQDAERYHPWLWGRPRLSRGHLLRPTPQPLPSLRQSQLSGKKMLHATCNTMQPHPLGVIGS